MKGFQVLGVLLILATSAYAQYIARALQQHLIMKRAAETSTVRIISYLESNYPSEKYNMDRALEEWTRLNKPSRATDPQAGEYMKEIINHMLSKIQGEYSISQKSSSSSNATENSTLLRKTLSFYSQALPRNLKLQIFDFLTKRIRTSKLADQMTLDDAIVFSYTWIEDIIQAHLATPAPTSAASRSNIVHKTSAMNDFLVRNVVRAANRLYPVAPPHGQHITIQHWWNRQRQHSTNVYKIYHFVHKLTLACRDNKIETATIYESLVDEYKKTGRLLDAYELNMIDYLSYQLFGFTTDHADPVQW